MFNIGFGEMLILGAIALIFIGPKQLPEVARIVGRTLNELKRATDDLTGNFVKHRNAMDDYVKKAERDIIQKVTAPSTVSQSVTTQSVDPSSQPKATENQEDPKS